MRLLGLDLGEKTIGLAVCDEEQLVATPLRTLGRHGGRRDIEAVASAMRQARARGLVLGLPLSLDGEEGAAARRVRRFGDRLQQHLGCPVGYVDERFTTVAAERALIAADVRRARRRAVIDQAAAVLILQSYIDRARAKGDAEPSEAAGPGVVDSEQPPKGYDR